ncbi:CHAP domain-containing protein [Staphylococcus caledonicus]|uniref:CHAP domain-containing protein n=1 Tax=Staphylococcus caledonicus TaxID=2741333 RepID=UPI0018E45C32|nr:CHAP domain-containing protein [Staphylococcus caledonicus]
MKKLILVMILSSALFTGGALFDGVDNQDMTQPTIHFWEKNPMKFNTYVKGQCTYYVFNHIRQDGNMINNKWGDAKYWAEKADDEGYKVNHVPSVGSILQYPKGEHGHVAYIEKVNSDGSLMVSDMNYRKPYEVTKRTVSSYQVDSFNYIHPKNNVKT